MSYDPFEVLQEKVAAPRSQGAEREAVPATPSISLAEAAEQSGLPEAVLAAASAASPTAPAPTANKKSPKPPINSPAFTSKANSFLHPSYRKLNWTMKKMGKMQKMMANRGGGDLGGLGGLMGR